VNFLKRNPISDEKLNRIIKILAIILLGLAVLFMAVQFSALWSWMLKAVKAVIVPVALAYIIALIIFPIIKYIERKGIGPRWLSLVIVLLLTFGIIFAAFYFIAPFVATEITNFFNNDFQKIIDYFTIDLRDEFILGSDIYDQIYNYVQSTNLVTNWLDNIVPSIISYITSVALPIFVSVALVPIMLIYYLRDYELIGERLRSIIPPSQEKHFVELSSRLNTTVGAYLRGQLILMIFIGVAATIAYKLIGMKYYLVFGIIVGLTNIIPYFGSVLAAIPPIIYSFVSGGDPGPLLVLVVNFGLQQVEGNFFQPMIMSHQLKMHPIIIMISIMFFGTLFGAIGVVFASPIAASIKVFYQYYQEEKAKKVVLNLPPGGKAT
jgi:putative permease